jgi:trehalose 6-phosphate synthase/phosphatase
VRGIEIHFCAEPIRGDAVILVSNRLPVTVTRRRGRLEADPSAGGLAVGLEAFYRQHDARWVGWPGEVPESSRRAVDRKLRTEFHCHPVFLSRDLVRKYYAGVSNRTLWPLFHSFPTYARYDEPDWVGYRQANRVFADRVAALAKPDEVVWVHDYHLMLVPKYLREKKPDAKIGFFLHIPFPPYSDLRQLPWCREVVEALLGADLIGFHTFDDAQAFLNCVRRLLGLDNELGQVVVGHRVVQVDVFPMGVDFRRISTAVQGEGMPERVARLREGLGASKLVFSQSRLDYTKGIPQALRGIAALLETRREWRGRFVYQLVVVPSREIVDRYAEEKREIDRLAGEINSRYGTFEWTPIRYMYRYLDFEELVALYRAADVALITPLRDGMNLVAKEYLAAKEDLHGALVLSEMAGAARELHEALIVNPNSAADVADALRQALEMPEAEQIRRNRLMRARLEQYDVQRWAGHFLERLDEAVTLSRSLAVRILTRADREALVAAYTKANRRLLLLDYDGTLVPFTPDPAQAVPSARAIDLLQVLCKARGNQVVLISGRKKDDLSVWLGSLWMTLVAENGAWVRERGKDTWEATTPIDVRWKERLRPVLQRFVNRIPGSAIEEKETSLVWHYRRVDVNTGALAARELIDTLTNLTANLELVVFIGNRSVEVRSSRVSKGTFFQTHLAQEPWDFILAMGDDWTDESLFSVLPPESHSVRIGLTASTARFNVESAEDALQILERLRDVT